MKKIFILTTITFILQTINLQLKAQAPPPHRVPEIHKYIGDLSISMSTDSLSYDNCLKKFKAYYTITVNNKGGNIPFTFLIKTTVNGHDARFYYTDGSNLFNGKILIKNIGIEESRTFNGFIISGTQKNLEGPDVIVKVSIPYEQELGLLIGNNIYKIQTDLIPRNNIATVNMELPHLLLESSPFDELNIITMPNVAELAGNLVYNEYPYELPSTNVPWGYACDDTIGLFYYQNFGGINFVKAKCLDSGKPVYYMKHRDKYITSLGMGSNRIMLKTANSQDETLRQWIFVKPPSGSGFYIYNVAWGKTRRLKIIWSSRGFCTFNALVMAPPNDSFNSNQIFNFDN
jgi:hypothetical protein